MKIIIDTYPNIQRETTGHRIRLTLIDGSIVTIDEPVSVNDSLRVDVIGPMTVSCVGNNSAVIRI